MTAVVMLFLILLGSLLQSVTPPWLVMGGAKAPLLLGLVLYYALTRERGTTFLAAILAGVMEDVLSMTPLGYSSAVYCVAGLVANGFKGVFYAESPVTAGVFGAGGGICANLAVGFLLQREGLIAASGHPAVMRLAGIAVLGLLCTPFVFGAAFGLDRMLGNLRSRREAVDVEFGSI